MCMPKMPEYNAPPSYALSKPPDNAALYASARARAAQRGGGSRRSTVLGGLQGDTRAARTTSPTFGQGATVLG